MYGTKIGILIKTIFKSGLNHILNCVNECDFGTKCFVKAEHFVLRLISVTDNFPGYSINKSSIGFLSLYISPIGLILILELAYSIISFKLASDGVVSSIVPLSLNS